MSSKFQILLFDDQCNKCNRWADFIRNRDPGSRVRLIGQNTEEGKEKMKLIPKKIANHDSVFLLSRDGKWFSKSSAIWRVCTELRFPWPLASSMFLVPWPIRDFFYDIYARMRK